MLVGTSSTIGTGTLFGGPGDNGRTVKIVRCAGSWEAGDGLVGFNGDVR
jgi:hypothetical protein